MRKTIIKLLFWALVTGCAVYYSKQICCEVDKGLGLIFGAIATTWLFIWFAFIILQHEPKK